MSNLDWKGLLHWSMKYSDGTKPSEIDSEKAEFLEKVMNGLADEDPVERMKLAIETLLIPLDPTFMVNQLMLTNNNNNNNNEMKDENKVNIPSELSTEIQQWLSMTNEQKIELREDVIKQKMRCLDELEDIVCQIDNAVDFIKLNGYIAIKQCITNDKEERVVAPALGLLHTLVHNNPKTQTFFMQVDALKLLCSIVDPSLNNNNNNSNKILYKALHAISGMIINFLPGMKYFIEHNGYSILIHLLTKHDNSSRVNRKILTILLQMWRSGEITTKIPKKSPLIPTLCTFIGHDDIDVRENALRVLLVLANTDQPSNLHQMRRVQNNLEELLKQRLNTINSFQTIEDREQCQDEIQLIEKLISILFEK